MPSGDTLPYAGGATVAAVPCSERPLATEAALATGVISKRSEKVDPAKRWPVGVDEDALGISGLPEEKSR